MATPKTLSTGTLSLKFMQNAQRAKQQQQVELERAAVKDEAEWEVPLAVRQAWGLPERGASSTGDAQPTAICDSSYMGFVYGPSSVNDDEPGPSRPRGRRTFNKKGEEVSSSQLPDDESSKSLADSKASPAKGKMYARPSSISLSSFSNTVATSGKNPKKGEKSVFSSSRDAVFGFDPTGVPAGITSPQTTTIAANSSGPVKPGVASTNPPAFLKPAGVDAPGGSTIPPDDSTSGGARKEKKVKRARKEIDLDNGKSDSTPKKKKKKQQPA